jgi:hypothetical protein
MTEQQQQVLNLASRLHVDLREVELALALARTGRVDLITAVAAGRISIGAALLAAKSVNPIAAHSEPGAVNSLAAHRRSFWNG